MVLGYETHRESWYLINKSNSLINIGGLDNLPTLKPNIRVDVLRFHTREEISMCAELSKLVKYGKIQLIKQRLDGTSEEIPASESYRALTPAEEYEPELYYSNNRGSLVFKKGGCG